MKIASFFKVLFLLFLTIGTLQAQEIIYSEDFNDDVGKGIDGDVLNDIADLSWSLNVDNCTFSGVGDYVKVVSTGSDRLEAVDCDGELIWRSPIVNLSDYTDISISILAGEVGSGTNASNKYVRLYYILDGGGEVSFFESSVNWTSELSAAIEAAERLDASVVDMRWVKPMDEAKIAELSATHELLVAVEENALAGGAGAGIAEYLAAQELNTPLLMMGLPDQFIEHGEHSEQLSYAQLDSDGIYRSIQRRLLTVDVQPTILDSVELIR